MIIPPSQFSTRGAQKYKTILMKPLRIEQKDIQWFWHQFSILNNHDPKDKIQLGTGGCFDIHTV